MPEATAYALERHGREAGCSQEQQECVQVHVSIEAVVGRGACGTAQQCATNRIAATPAGLSRSPPATSSAGGQPDRDRMTEKSRYLLQRARRRPREWLPWGPRG